MKKLYILGISLFSLFMASCSDETMDRINYDEAHPSASSVSAAYQITDAEVATAYSTINGAYAWYVVSYTEQMCGTGNNQLRNVEVRNYAEMAAATTFNNEWNSTYLNLHNIAQAIAKCKDGGLNAGKTDILGVAQVLNALNWGVLTDLHGDVPYSECFTEVSAPKIDTQKFIYDEILKTLDEAIANLANGGSSLAKQDIIYGGDTKKWIAFAHALKARYLLHTYGVNKTEEHLNKVLAEAQAAVEGGFAGAYLDIFNGKTADNSWSAYHWSRYYLASSKTVDDLMLDREDPREKLYNVDLFKKGLGVSVPGDKEAASLTESKPYPLWLENGAANLALMGESEIYFILAEVKARLGQDAKADFETAVKVSMADYASASGKAISDEEVAAYLEKIAVKYSENALNEIFVQKYLAQTRGEVLETYNDIRRCNFVDGSYAVKLTNPNNTYNGTTNRWPLRLPYGESDVTSNPNVTAAYGDGGYVFTEAVWWAGGNK